MKTVSDLQESIQNNLSKQIPDTSSIWTLTALDDDHRDWIRKYDKSLQKYQTTESDHKLDEELGTESTADMFHFNDLRSWIGYLGTAAFDGYQRFRMRALKHSVISYEEFMIGAMHSFTALQSMDISDSRKISKCFVPRMHEQVTAVKEALFDISEDGEQTHSIRNLMPFGSTLRIAGLYGGQDSQEQMNLEYLEMFFTVRYYYSLQKMEHVDAVVDSNDALKQRYADIEWLGIFQPLGVEDGKYERFELCEKGFIIHNVEVNEC